MRVSVVIALPWAGPLSQSNTQLACYGPLGSVFNPSYPLSSSHLFMENGVCHLPPLLTHRLWLLITRVFQCCFQPPFLSCLPPPWSPPSALQTPCSGWFLKHALNPPSNSFYISWSLRGIPFWLCRLPASSTAFWAQRESQVEQGAFSSRIAQSL